METATMQDLDAIMSFYDRVVEALNQTDVNIGWDTKKYPNREYVSNAIYEGHMRIIRDGKTDILAAASVNHTVNPAYETMPWKVKGPAEHISSIHVLAVDPRHRGENIASRFLKEIEEDCKKHGDVALHFDVMVTNEPAHQLYTKNGYDSVICTKMYYEPVAWREFWLIEKVL